MSFYHASPVRAKSVCRICGGVVPNCNNPRFDNLGLCRLCRIAEQRVQSYKRNYGITIHDYGAMFQQQGGCCAICGKHASLYQLHVDHDHATGKVRGLLCVGCNTGLGALGDTAESLARALTYLQRTV